MLPGTYLTLLTGFPWHIAGAVVVAILIWIIVWRWPRARAGAP